MRPGPFSPDNLDIYFSLFLSQQSNERHVLNYLAQGFFLNGSFDLVEIVMLVNKYGTKIMIVYCLMGKDHRQ